MILDFELDFTEYLPTDTYRGQAFTATAWGKHALDAAASQAGVGSIAGAGQAVGRDWGAGEEVFPYVKTQQAFNNLTNVTVDIVAGDACDANGVLSGNLVVLSSRVLTLAQLAANKIYGMPALAGGSYRRFLNARFTPSGTANTTGTVACGLQRSDSRPQEIVTSF